METVQILQLVLVFLVFLIMILAVVYAILIIKNKKESNKTENNKLENKKDDNNNSIVQDKKSIYNFMEFDEVKDNMIIRKNRSQYIMVINCRGVNYDLMSEEEKISVESGFVQFLNTLRFPIQLYVQTTSLNLKDSIDGYKERLKSMQKDIQKTNNDMQVAKRSGNIKLYDKLAFELRRKQNVLEYSADISEYIARLSTNKNVLQQKTYVVVSYYAAEAEKMENASKEEIDALCFSELYTRTQTILRALGSAGVIGKILDSEELSELLYVAYNRDESEIMQLSKALDAGYDSLYSTGKDILKKRQDAIDEMLDREAVDLAANSITIADEKIKNEKKIKEKALEIIDEYKDQMTDELYNKTKEEIQNNSTEKNEQTNENIEQKKTVKRGRPKKTL